MADASFATAVQGSTAIGQPAVEFPVYMGGADAGGLKRGLLVDATGNLAVTLGGAGSSTMVQGLQAEGAAVTENPVVTGMVSGGTLIRYLQSVNTVTNTNGQNILATGPSLLDTVSGNYWNMRGDGGGRALVVGGVAAGTAASSIFPVYIGASDGSGNVNAVRSQSLASDGLTAGANGLQMVGNQFLFNGTTFDRQRCNTDVTLLASASRTTTQTSASITTYNAAGITVWLNTTIVGTSSNTLSVVEVDPASGATFTLLASAAIVGNGLTRLHIYPGVTAAANLSASIKLPRTIQIIVTAGNANPSTYSLGYSLLD